MIWLLLLGVCITLGGFCLCCGCIYCTDGTLTATMQIDMSGIVADEDNGSGCCDGLDGTYILDIDPNNPCVFSKVYENGACATDACDACDSTDCVVTCDTAPGTQVCPPSSGSTYCGDNGIDSGSVTHGAPNCTDCKSTESGSINLAEGVTTCDCTCVISALVWDVDLMIVDYPAATWAVPGDFIWFCSCTPANDCTAGVGSSGTSLYATLQASGGGGVELVLNGAINGGTFTTTTEVSVDPETECGTEISALDLSAGLSTTPCGSTKCLCTFPTSITATYLP